MRRLYTNKIVVHHTVMPQNMDRVSAMDQILRTHRNNGLAYDGQIAYHFVIGNDWEEFGRSLNSVGYHAGHWLTNLSSVAVAMMGNFENDRLNKYQEDRLRNRMQYWADLYNLGRSNIIVHRDVKATACPGRNIDHTKVTELFSKPKVPVNGHGRTPLPRQKGK